MGRDVNREFGTDTEGISAVLIRWKCCGVRAGEVFCPSSENECVPREHKREHKILVVFELKRMNSD